MRDEKRFNSDVYTSVYEMEKLETNIFIQGMIERNETRSFVRGTVKIAFPETKGEDQCSFVPPVVLYGIACLGILNLPSAPPKFMYLI